MNDRIIPALGFMPHELLWGQWESTVEKPVADREALLRVMSGSCQDSGLGYGLGFSGTCCTGSTPVSWISRGSSPRGSKATGRATSQARWGTRCGTGGCASEYLDEGVDIRDT